MSRRPGELGFSLALLAFALFAIAQSYAIAGFARLSSPGVFPMLASAVMLLSALAILRDTAARAAPPTMRERDVRSSVLPPRVILMIALLIAYVAVMPRLGFLASSGLFLLTSLLWLWRAPWWASLAVTVGALAGCHLLFRRVFQVVLPEGALERWLASLGA